MPPLARRGAQDHALHATAGPGVASELTAPRFTWSHEPARPVTGRPAGHRPSPSAGTRCRRPRALSTNPTPSSARRTTSKRRLTEDQPGSRRTPRARLDTVTRSPRELDHPAPADPTAIEHLERRAALARAQQSEPRVHREHVKAVLGDAAVRSGRRERRQARAGRGARSARRASAPERRGLTARVSSLPTQYASTTRRSSGSATPLQPAISSR